jgi:hypothetical protein
MRYTKAILILVILLSFFTINVKAADTVSVQAVVEGTVKEGQSIQILINIKDIKSLYAAELQYKYDPTILKIISIEAGDLINKPNINKFEAIKKIDEKAGIARYGFTCLGDITGFSGSGTLLKINVEVIKTENIFLNNIPKSTQFTKDNNIKLQLCDSDINELDYVFTTKLENSTVDSSKGSEKSNESVPAKNSSTAISNNTQETKNTRGQEEQGTKGQQTTNTNGQTVNNSTESTVKTESSETGIKAPEYSIQNNKSNLQVKSSNQVLGDKQSRGLFFASVIAVVVLLSIGGCIVISLRKKKLLKKEKLNL